jgi:hypothetical protein
MDLELYCERKHHEATLITLMLVGRLFGAIFSTWQADIAHSKGKVLMLYVVSNFVSVLAVLIIIISKSLLVMGAMLMLWCFTCEILNSFINSIPLLFFEGSLRMKIWVDPTLPIYNNSQLEGYDIRWCGSPATYLWDVLVLVS